MTITVRTWDGLTVTGPARILPNGAVDIETRRTPEVTEVTRIGLDRIAEVIAR